MTLMPVSNISVFDSSWSKVGALRWMGQRSVTSSVSPSSTFRHSPRVLNTLPLVTSPTGTVMAAGVGHLGAADQAVGGLHRDRADQAVAQVLGDLEGQRLRLAAEASSSTCSAL